MIRMLKQIPALTLAIREQTEQMKHDAECRKSREGVVTKQDLREMEDRIMSQISDWFVKIEPKLTRVQTGLDAVQALVEKLQNSPGAITPEDQALLDQIETKVDAIANDADSVPAPPSPA